MKTYIAIFEVPDDYKLDLHDDKPVDGFFIDANGDQRVVGADLKEVVHCSDCKFINDFSSNGCDKCIHCEQSIGVYTNFEPKAKEEVD